MKLVPYWSDTAPPFRGGETGPVEGAADVVVVGGGFTGLSAALALGKAGASVVVLEEGKGRAARRPAATADTSTTGSRSDFRGAVAKLGLDKAREVYHAFDAGVDLVERIAREEQIACDFRRCGKIKLAAKPAHYDKIATPTR